MNFNEFKKPVVVNTRKPGGLPSKIQEYTNIKYRKAVSKKSKKVISKFTVSKKQFAELGLAENALSPFLHPTDKNIVLLGVVSDADGKVLRKRKNKEKGDSFKSDTLEVALNVAGIIDSSDASLGKNQFIDLTSVGTDVEIDGVKVFNVLQLSKGVGKAPKAPKVETPASGTASASTTATEDAKEAPVTAAPAASDWD